MQIAVQKDKIQSYIMINVGQIRQKQHTSINSLFDLHSGKKSESNPRVFKYDFRKLRTRYKNYQQAYTDGSKEDPAVDCALISDNLKQNHSFFI